MGVPAPHRLLRHDDNSCLQAQRSDSTPAVAGAALRQQTHRTGTCAGATWLKALFSSGDASLHYQFLDLPPEGPGPVSRNRDRPWFGNGDTRGGRRLCADVQQRGLCGSCAMTSAESANDAAPIAALSAANSATKSMNPATWWHGDVPKTLRARPTRRASVCSACRPGGS